MTISVVSPVYKAEQIVALLIEKTREVLLQMNVSFEIILVEDGSPDNSWEAIKQESIRDKRVKAIKLSRNFGQHSAITAGLEHCSGEWVIVMDCDLQDQPSEIPKLYRKAIEGYDLVLARRAQRNDNWLKKISSKLFYSTLGYLTDTTQDPTIANFGIYHSRVITSFLSMGDYIKYFPSMVQWVGFKRESIDVEHAERLYGKTSYSFSKLLKLAVNVILSFSDKPLRLTVKLGLLISSLSVFFALYNLYRYCAGKIVVQGWTTLIVSIWFLSGVIIFTLGLVGLYIGKTFDKVKERPVYIINQTLNVDEK